MTCHALRNIQPARPYPRARSRPRPGTHQRGVKTPFTTTTYGKIDQPAATDPPCADEETDAETVAAATIELVDHSVLARTDRRQSLQLPGDADRSIRVSVLDDPFDDSEDPFEEPVIDEAGEGEAGEGEAVEEDTGDLGDDPLEDRDDGLESEEDLTELEQAEENAGSRMAAPPTRGRASANRPDAIRSIRGRSAGR